MPISRPTTTPRPTAIDVTAPTITRERMSRPYWSVPKGWAADGPCSRPPIDIASGSAGVQTRLSVAVATRATVIATPTRNVRWRTGRLVRADAGIEQDVGEVDDDVDLNERGGDEEGHALHDRQVARGDGAEREPAEAGQGEHGFQNDRARHEVAELDPGHRDHRDQRIAEGVLADDRSLVQPLGPRGADVVLAQHLQHGRARGPNQHRGLEEAERRRRQEQRAQAGPEPARPALEAAGLEPAELHREEEDQQQARPERRHRDANLRDDHRQVVARAPVARGRLPDDGRLSEWHRGA